MQALNVPGALSIYGPSSTGPVVLVDDILDSRWTLTIAGWLLRSHGSGLVYPFSLAQASVQSK